MRRSFVAALALAAVAVLGSGCATTDPGDGRDVGARTLTNDELQKYAKVRLTAGTVVESTRYQAGIDYHLTAKLRVPAAELPAFLTGSGFTAPAAGTRAVTNGDRTGDAAWKPDGATDVAGLDQTAAPVEAVYRKVLVDNDRPAEPVVYLVAFTT
ncbi:hypothetical protein Val02_35970 [Virgisporangium aliadipatigenens]|uniref:Lipoprotein n=1 Tax=Virgisporangium aliadipatigenens TaxID=741659 RepID=A0A8J3YK85_9ACTN|nr:hypothetical protein [Virgisporangium aliadipatigenens]GIJ46711.1 hypothetical protein Val02_35970 [Virgisporangium aliadipatigenens]